jgi:hypothetical protein
MFFLLLRFDIVKPNKKAFASSSSIFFCFQITIAMASYADLFFAMWREESFIREIDGKWILIKRLRFSLLLIVFFTVTVFKFSTCFKIFKSSDFWRNFFFPQILKWNKNKIEKAALNLVKVYKKLSQNNETETVIFNLVVDVRVLQFLLIFFLFRATLKASEPNRPCVTLDVRLPKLQWALPIYLRIKLRWTIGNG